MKTFVSIIVITWMTSAQISTFKSNQLRYPRVSAAYEKKGALMTSELEEIGIQDEAFTLFLQAFKAEDIIEIWIRQHDQAEFQLFRTIPIAGRSGGPGPKRQQGDLQVPEGFYFINRFNPMSAYHLSLGINYPNPSDRILGKQHKLGGDIFIHGNVVTVGCLPLTDERIEELYLLCVEAKDRGQEHIPVYIYPGRFPTNTTDALDRPLPDSVINGLWKDLELAQQYVDTHHRLPCIEFLENGRHHVGEGFCD